MRASVFIAGGTGYIGRRLIAALVARGHTVRALARAGSEGKLPPGAVPVIGDVLRAASFAPAIAPNDVVVHLVGTPRPSPAKAAQFEAIDFVSARECHAAAERAGARHFVYVSVAHPAPVMHAYIDVRVRVEESLRAGTVPYTVLRPWYVLGPGHRWPYALMPLYWVAALVPSLQEGASRLGLVTLAEMVGALVWSVENAGLESRVLEVPDIRRPENTTA